LPDRRRTRNSSTTDSPTYFGPRERPGFTNPLNFSRCRGSSQHLMPERNLTQRLQSLWQNVRWMGKSFRWVLTPLWAGGVLLQLAGGVKLTSSVPTDGGHPRGEVLVLIWMIVPLLYFGLFVRSGTAHDRYLLLALPPAFLAVGCCTMWMGTLVDRVQGGAAAAIMLAVVALGTTRFLPDADNRIRSKARSYDGLRDAGLWIRERTGPEDLVLSRLERQRNSQLDDP
jgi:hypothetical protein